MKEQHGGGVPYKATNVLLLKKVNKKEIVFDLRYCSKGYNKKCNI